MRKLFSFKDPYDDPEDVANAIVKTITEEFTLCDQNMILETIFKTIISKRQTAIKQNTEALDQFLKQLKEHDPDKR